MAGPPAPAVHLQVLASGSAGNATLVRAGETHLLVDCGLPPSDLAARLRRARFEPGRLDHLLISHGHLDHARSAGRVSKRTGATVHCAERLLRARSIARAARRARLPIGGALVLGSGSGEARDRVRVRTVRLPHDAEPTVAFRLEQDGRVAVVLTDMGRPDREVARRLHGAHVLVLESNHDPALLASGPYSEPLKRRIAGPGGHLSNAQAAQMLELLAGAELHTLVLAHLSLANNRPELALESARAALRRLGRDDVRILLARQDEIGPNLAV